MQVISGQYKGKLIKSPNETATTHPMGSREKIALFNILNSLITSGTLKNFSQMTILDAFAGSGALGIEAISRGAKSVVFVEKSSKVANTICDNLKNLHLPADIDAKVIIKDLAKINFSTRFDLIFADPPYDNFNLAQIERLTHFLRPQGLLVLSHPNVNFTLDSLEKLTTRSYAKANISIFLQNVQ